MKVLNNGNIRVVYQSSAEVAAEGRVVDEVVVRVDNTSVESRTLFDVLLEETTNPADKASVRLLFKFLHWSGGSASCGKVKEGKAQGQR